MKTRLPIATISYNTELFLQLKLKEWKRAKIVSEWYYIKHEPEDDEGGKKEHIHLWICPARAIQTEDLVSELVELDPRNPKPRKSLSFRSSKFDDWYLYGLHDVAYLASKDQSRIHHYTPEDFVACDEDELERRVHEIRKFDLTPYAMLQDYAAQGLSWPEVVNRGQIPIPQIRSFYEAYMLIRQYRTERAGRAGHDQDELEVDEQTGEVIES